jgi:hypothetical protein
MKLAACCFVLIVSKAVTALDEQNESCSGMRLLTALSAAAAQESHAQAM